MNYKSVNRKAENIRDVIRYLQKFKNALIVIYLDDKTIESPLFSSHIRDIALLHEAGIKVVIIPGARRRIDDVLTDAKIHWEFKDNIRITSAEAMPLIKMAAFDVSNIVMTSLAANNINAVIGNWVKSRAKGILNGFDFGTAGEIEKLEVEAIKKVLDGGFIPIFPCIGWNAVGRPYNISSILLAQQIAVNLKADKLFFVMEDGGIKSSKYKIPAGFALSENGDVPAMNLEEVDRFLLENQGFGSTEFVKKSEGCAKTSASGSEASTNSVSDSDLSVDGYISINRLLKTAQQACREGVTRVHIIDGNLDGVLPCEIFSDLGSGTMIYTSNYGKIRQMEQTDIPSVLDVIGPFIESGKLLPRTEKQLSDAINDFIVYELDGGVHACSSLHIYQDGQAEIAAVAVDEKFAHMGIGPKMIKFLIGKAQESKAKSVFIMTTQAADWFEKLGFSEDSIESLPEARKKLWTPERNSKVYRLQSFKE